MNGSQWVAKEPNLDKVVALNRYWWGESQTGGQNSGTDGGGSRRLRMVQRPI